MPNGQERNPGPEPELADTADKFSFSVVCMLGSAALTTVAIRYNAPNLLVFSAISGIEAVDSWKKGWAALDFYKQNKAR